MDGPLPSCSEMVMDFFLELEKVTHKILSVIFAVQLRKNVSKGLANQWKQLCLTMCIAGFSSMFLGKKVLLEDWCYVIR